MQYSLAFGSVCFALSACSGQSAGSDQDNEKQRGTLPLALNVQLDAGASRDFHGNAAVVNVYQASDGTSIEWADLELSAQGDADTAGFRVDLPSGDSISVPGSYPLVANGDDQLVVRLNGIDYVSKSGSIEITTAGDQLAGSFEAALAANAEFVDARGEFVGPWAISCNIVATPENSGVVTNAKAWVRDTSLESEFCQRFMR